MTKATVYSIDSGVPAPADGPKTRENVPVHQLEVGDSILFPASLRKAVQSLASRLKAQENKRFTIRKEGENSARIWRVS